MARPIETGLKYFPVDTNFDDEFRALEELHGNDGFAWILKFWQSAYKTNDGIVDLSGIYRVLAAKTCRISTDKQEEIIRDALQLGLLTHLGNGKYTSNGIQKRIKKVVDEREKGRNYSKNRLSERKPPDNLPKTGESKVKEKEIKIKEFIPPTFDEFLIYCKENLHANIAQQAYRGYVESKWHDVNGKAILNWKQKLQNGWFRPENKDKSATAIPVYYGGA
jgi:hypothetical protein